MFIAFCVLLIMTVTLMTIAYRRGDGSLVRGLKAGRGMLMGTIPLFLLAFPLAGLIQVAIPADLIRSWLGQEAGWNGIFIGSIAGTLIPGGPYVAFPIIAAIINTGASIGTAVAFITGWAMLTIMQMPYELTFIGIRFMTIRIISMLIVPPIAGIAAQWLFGGGF
ncbi:MAG: permease [Deltaproteobacteria bacterium]|nr:permease [Deltaproteobacteria bacterium]